MKDKEFLQFIHDRLQYQHNENPNFDYMHKLRAVIKAYDADKETANVTSVVCRSRQMSELDIVKTSKELPQEPETFVPLVGEECEIECDGFWGRIGIVAVTRQHVIFCELGKDNEQIVVRSARSFRPVKSEREKIKEWVESKIDCVESFQLDQAIMINLMLDLGCLVIPENK